MFLPLRYVEGCVAVAQGRKVTPEQAAKQLASLLSVSHGLSRYKPVPAPETEAQLELYRAILREGCGSATLRDLLAKIVFVHS